MVALSDDGLSGKVEYDFRPGFLKGSAKAAQVPDVSIYGMDVSFQFRKRP
jgi:hypothetical protein